MCALPGIWLRGCWYQVRSTMDAFTRLRSVFPWGRTSSLETRASYHLTPRKALGRKRPVRATFLLGLRRTPASDATCLAILVTRNAGASSFASFSCVLLSLSPLSVCWPSVACQGPVTTIPPSRSVQPHACWNTTRFRTISCTHRSSE
jgi:hypothetical protein